MASPHLGVSGGDELRTAATNDPVLSTTASQALFPPQWELPGPPPYLDVLSFHSRRLLPFTREEIAARELEWQRNNRTPASSSAKTDLSIPLTPEEEAARLDELLTSVHLLLEPIQLPDLSHTGVFDPATSSLQPAAAAVSTSKLPSDSSAKLAVAKPDKADEIKLFYPSGAKNANMRDFIKETMQKHMSAAELAEIPSGTGGRRTLGVSASTPSFRSPAPASHGRTSGVAKAARKKSKLSAVKSPVKESLASSALLNPHLTRQAKDIIAAVRTNSSKINELISK
ncbi:hypothetical protein BBJ28_00012149 [Nothophytophthora sp. Chile5]|nr:hypothetical protein BBJ28_00012149 [Nothophytophthora sp. Chile5]